MCLDCLQSFFNSISTNLEMFNNNNQLKTISIISLSISIISCIHLCHLVPEEKITLTELKLLKVIFFDEWYSHHIETAKDPASTRSFLVCHRSAFFLNLKTDCSLTSVCSLIGQATACFKLLQKCRKTRIESQVF